MSVCSLAKPLLTERIMSTEQLYWSSELHCAYFALRVLEKKLDDSEEWGTTIFRWPDLLGGWRYSFQRPVYIGNNGRFWRPLGRIPKGTHIWAHCHSHPVGGYFSKQDTSWARGEHGIDPFINQNTNDADRAGQSSGLVIGFVLKISLDHRRPVTEA